MGWGSTIRPSKVTERASSGLKPSTRKRCVRGLRYSASSEVEERSVPVVVADCGMTSLDEETKREVVPEVQFVMVSVHRSVSRTILMFAGRGSNA